MITTTRFKFYELSELPDLPGRSPRKYDGHRTGEADAIFLIVRSLPLVGSEGPVALFHFMNRNESESVIEMGIIPEQWNTTQRAEVRDATIEIVERLLLTGIVHDGGKVLIPRTKELRATMDVSAGRDPGFASDRSRITDQVKVRSAIDGTILSDEMADPVVKRTIDLSVVGRKSREDGRVEVRFSWKRKAGL